MKIDKITEEADRHSEILTEIATQGKTDNLLVLVVGVALISVVALVYFFFKFQYTKEKNKECIDKVSAAPILNGEWSEFRKDFYNFLKDHNEWKIKIEKNITKIETIIEQNNK